MPGKSTDCGVTAVNNRQFIEVVSWIAELECRGVICRRSLVIGIVFMSVTTDGLPRACGIEYLKRKRQTKERSFAVADGFRLYAGVLIRTLVYIYTCLPGTLSRQVRPVHYCASPPPVNTLVKGNECNNIFHIARVRSFDLAHVEDILDDLQDLYHETFTQGK